MATLAKLSIYLGLDSSGMTKGVSAVTGKLNNLKGAVESATTGGLMKIGGVVATFLTVEKILGRIRSLLTNGERVQRLLPEADAQPLIAMMQMWQQVNEQIDRAFLTLANAVAPTIITIVENTRLLLEPLIAANDILKTFVAGIDWIAARWADLQSILSGSVQTIAAEYTGMWAGIRLGFWEVVREIEKWTKKDMGGKLGLDKATAELNTALDLGREGIKKYFDGLNGNAGAAYLEQVEKKRKELENGSLKWSDIYEQKATKLKSIVRDIAPPGAFERGTSAAVSAVNNVQRQNEQKLLKAAEKTAVDIAALRKAIQDTYPGVVIL